MPLSKNGKNLLDKAFLQRLKPPFFYFFYLKNDEKTN